MHMKINILDKTIFNRIAAGEVVERPASVVKELIENSIDSGATQINIEVTEGGIKKIKVSDNGCGIESSELPKAFMPHATSKIATIEDLDKIGTLGFRGEALSSIASVAKVNVISKPQTADLGSKIELSGGEILSQTDSGSPVGTTVTVENLFYNVPARAKFLKKPKQEETEITNIVSRLILANPTISFKYIANDKIVFLTQGNGLEEAIYVIYGKVTMENLLPIEYIGDIFKITGFICKPTFSKPNRTYQTLLINGRYVINQTISTAVYKAYEGFLMKGNFPFFVLNINIPLDKVDVNVHPNKLDVKFEESNRIFGIILHAISNTLLTSSHIKFLDDEQIISPAVQGNLHLQNLSQNEGKNFDNKTPETNPETFTEAILNNSEELYKKEYETRKSLNFFLNKSDSVSEFEINSDHGLSQALTQQAMQHNNIIQLNSNFTQAQNASLFESDAYKIVGVLFGTFIIVEQGTFAYFIDQHAAHERLLYDKFKAQLQNRQIPVQQLLVPYILDVNYMESEFINTNLENFKQLGFEIEPFGANTFKVSTVPLLFKDISINSFFEVVLKDINSTIKITPSTILEGYLARSACRTAIKANDLMSNSEIEILLNNLNKTNQVLLCPHGRPVVVKVPKTDLEKWFKRIV